MDKERHLQADDASIDLAHEPVFALGELCISPSTREVISPDRMRIADPKVMQVLVCLARAKDAVVSRDDLIARCWGGRIVSEDAINRCIARVRDLAESENGPYFSIETVPRVGYRLLSTTVQHPEAGKNPDTSRTRTICVLPFLNMSGDIDQEYFSDGITEDITTALSKISALRVVARNTAFQFKGRNTDIREVAAQLKVSHVLEGSVRKVANNVRISAQLVDGKDGTHLWAERYDRDLCDIFELQSEISETIVNALKLKLLPAEKKAVERRGTKNAEAYNLYLMARHEHMTGVAGYARWHRSIVRLCQRATELDPNYASAWALMGWVQGRRPTDNAAGETGRVAAERALALDPLLAEAHAAIAEFMLWEDQADAAAKEIAIAVRLDPDSYEVNRAAGIFNFTQRHFEEAIPYFEKAVVLADTDLIAASNLLTCYLSVGGPTAAQGAARTMVEHAEKVLAKDSTNSWAMALGAGGLAALGQVERARDWMSRSEILDPDNVFILYSNAVVALALDGKEEGLARLAAVLPKVPGSILIHAASYKGFDPIRDDPRFEAMMAEARARLAAKGGQ